MATGLSYIPANSVRVVGSPPPPKHGLSLLAGFYFNHSDGCMIFICIFLMAGNVEHVFMGLFAICMSSLVTHPFMQFSHSLTGLFVLYRLTLRVFKTWFPKHVFQGCSLTFHALHMGSRRAEVFSVGEAPSCTTHH